MAAHEGGFWFAGNWWRDNFWESNWFNGNQVPGDGEAAAVVWAFKRRKRKQKLREALVTHNPLPPLAVLLEALED